MSLSDRKRGIFTTIGAYTALASNVEVPDIKKMFPSENNVKDAISFLVDTLKAAAGTEALKKLMGDMIGNFIDEVEPKMKEGLKKQFTQINSDANIPNSFINTGINADLKSLDKFGKAKTSPTSDAGNLIYDTSIPNFDHSLFNAINTGSEVDFSVLKLSYNEVNDKINIKGNVDSYFKVGNFFSSYIDNATFLNKKEICSNLIDGVFGTLSNMKGGTQNEIYEQQKIKKILSNASKGNKSYELTQDELDELFSKSEQMKNNMIYYDMGCGVYGVALEPSELTDVVSGISVSSDSNYISNTLVNMSIPNDATAENNKEGIIDWTFTKLIENFIEQIIEGFTMSPQIQALKLIWQYFIGEFNELYGKIMDEWNSFKNMLNCLIDLVIQYISEFMFKLAIVYLTAILTPIIQEFIKERINQFRRSITSLLSNRFTKAAIDNVT